ncbi:MSMEG_0570 family nitrogen starvation response protein [Euhalothece natronophila Z-M001]|uniref:MSMEG_0570 family nitrogen starvation response protein n=1 Tax=Euhalothece natronophila Z-M001 TaxID=522448 RepID=A0A5B8NQX4_9CHRO|nr:MSMEG_0570 family nitrogen starvation response protein [Euhalothece natronophila]QDZ40679.1 MSMEG_0570 family nitrogen starvation response protein [Euhalothece natronophila Z-M001]
MPEVHFEIAWPDGSTEVCYSPSAVIKKYFQVGESYSLEDFVARCSEALNSGSERVKAKYGRPCGLALGQLEQIEAKAKTYQDDPSQTVQLIQFK